MPTLDLDDRQLYYEVRGEGEPLLCVHGLAVDAGMGAPATTLRTGCPSCRCPCR
ncbi:MAG: hypothetical protein AABM31_05465 [Actinomycetota bacterium]